MLLCRPFPGGQIFFDRSLVWYCSVESVGWVGRRFLDEKFLIFISWKRIGLNIDRIRVKGIIRVHDW